MSDIQKLRAERAESAKAANNVHSSNVNSWSAENQAEFDKHLTNVERLDAAINRHEKVLALAAEAHFDNATDEQIRDEFGKPTKAKASEFSNFIKNGWAGLPAGTSRISNAQTVGTNSEGGYAVSPEYQATIIESMKAYGGMRAVSDSIRTMTGANIPYPTGDATGEVGEQLDESSTAADLDTVFGVVNLPAFVFSSKTIVVSNQLLQDAFIDIEAYVKKVLAVRIARILNTKFTTGAGTTTPFGVSAAASAGATGATGTTLTVIYDKLVDLQHSVNREYRNLPNVGFMMADATLAIVRKIKDGNSRPIFVPGYETATDTRAPDSMLGSPIYINDDVAVMAANAKSILFGAFSKYMIRDVMDLVLHRFTDSAYARKNQTAFLGFQRHGGTLLDTAAVKYYANSAT
jgi:HK97 family phage major capsid protein